MTSTDPNSFSDPALKDAVRRVWGAQVAPRNLRDRVEAMGIGAATAPAADLTPSLSPQRRGWFRGLRHPRTLYSLAAAVALLIGFSVAYQLDQRSPDPFAIAPQPANLGSRGVLPASVARDLIDVHARCTAAASHDSFRDVPRDDFPSLRRRLERTLGFPVLAAPLDDGEGRWSFKGASLCPVDRVAASHLVFVRDRQAVSIFSLPRAAFPQARGDELLEDPNPDHPLAVFIRGDGVHCVVGSSADRSLSPQQLHAICDHLQAFLR
jgi:hypothetical protein